MKVAKYFVGFTIAVLLGFGLFQNCADSFNPGSYSASSMSTTPGTTTPTTATTTATNPCGVTLSEINACTDAVPAGAPIAVYRSSNPTLVVGDPLNLNFSVSSSTGGSYTYVWKHNGTKVADATATRMVTAVTAANAGTFVVTATNSAGAATATYNVTVQPNKAGPVAIVSPPESATVVYFTGAATPVYYPSAVYLTVSATGTKPLRYQWYFTPNTPGAAEAAIPGATGATYVMSPSPTTSGTFRVAVSNTVNGVVTAPQSASSFVQVIGL